MCSHQDLPVTYLPALREELVLTSHLLKRDPIQDSNKLLNAASSLSAPWWNAALDACLEATVVRRIAAALCKHADLAVISEAGALCHIPFLTSLEDQWAYAIVKRAHVQGLQPIDAMALAASDALTIASQEQSSRHSLYVINLSAVYDSLVLTGAYAFMRAPAVPMDWEEKLIRSANRALGEAALLANRCHH